MASASTIDEQLAKYKLIQEGEFNDDDDDDDEAWIKAQSRYTNPISRYSDSRAIAAKNAVFSASK